MDSSNEGSVSNSKAINGQAYDDELDRCEQVKEIKARIRELERNQIETRNRKERFLQNREERMRISRDVSLSMYKVFYFSSNNASAIFSTAKSRRQLDDQINKYESIANITQEENNNLKQQNEYLLEKLKKMREKEKKFVKIAEKAQKYKKLYEDAAIELGIVQEECEVYKNKAEEMKRMALSDVGKLEHKILPFVKNIDESYSNKSEVYTRERSDDSGRVKGNYSIDM